MWHVDWPCPIVYEANVILVVVDSFTIIYNRQNHHSLMWRWKKLIGGATSLQILSEQ
jgi:hypothetical protein